MAIELDDGTIVRSLPEQVDFLTTANENNEIAIDNLTARLEAAISGVLHYKGSVPTYADLPEEAEIGDVYNVIDTGANYAWTGSEWDELGSSVDVSDLVDKTSAQNITGQKSFFGGIRVNDIKDIILGEVNIEADLSPKTTETYKLGTSSKKWKEVWISDSINLGTSGVLKYENSAFSFNDDLIPAVTESYDLGSTTYRFKDINLSGKLNFGGIIALNGTNKYNFTNWNLLPYGSQDLGSSSYKWKDIYLFGKISDGTNEVTFADLKALIDYAKAQGWIS